MGDTDFKGDLSKSKFFAIRDTSHCELEFSWKTLNDYFNSGWTIYAINEGGIFLFLNNKDDDGKDWCKIRKH